MNVLSMPVCMPGTVPVAGHGVFITQKVASAAATWHRQRAAHHGMEVGEQRAWER